MNPFYIKANRIFTPIRKYAWIFTLLVAFGGLWYPKLGLLVIPVMVSLTTVAFFKGRYWCGNYCPHGSMFDSLLISLSRNRKIPKFFSSKVTVLVFFTWFSFNLIRKLIKVSAIFGTAHFWDKLGFIFVASYLMVTIVGGILSILISSRTWCNFCPMGVLQTISYKMGKSLGINKKTDKKVTVSRTEMCHTCGKCSRVCPMQLTPYLEFSQNNQFDNEACIRCSTCLNNCPAGILTLNNEENAILIKENTSVKGYEARQVIKARIENIRELSPDTREFTFRFEIPEKVEYKAGQFILVKIQEKPKMYRAYSISSYNKDNTQLSVTVKKVPNGYGTDIIFNTFKKGDKIELEGPMGTELVVDKKASKVIFIAGGIGITPFVPMVQDMIENQNAAQTIHLIYGVNYESDFMYNDHFEKMESVNSKFEYKKVVAFDDKWTGKKGFVTDVLKEMDLSGYKFYLCGPKPMIDATLKVLHKQGVKEDDIFYESA